MNWIQIKKDISVLILYLCRFMEYFIHQLSNGIRILLVPSPSAITHSCVVVNAGSRDETDEQSGIAHFIEHLLFKKTKKRSTHQILNRMEAVGGELNAYTTKEYTCLHASFLEPHVERSLELFHDILFQSVFPEEEMEKEKGVILDEIASYQDQPEEAIYDDFEDLLFKNHALGRNILGTAETVKTIQRHDIFNFMAQNYFTQGMIVAVMGNYKPEKIVKLAEKYFGAVAPNPKQSLRTAFVPNGIEKLKIAKSISQTHMVMGKTAYDMHHPDKVALLLLNNYLGGMGMSSKLNLVVREKYGIAYTIESNYIPLSDTGLFCIYFGTDEEKAAKAQKLIHKELITLCNQGLTEKQLQQAKQKFIGQIALGEENRMSLMISMAKSLMDFGKIDALPVVFEKIENIEVKQVLRVAQDIFNPEGLSSLTFHPQE